MFVAPPVALDRDWTAPTRRASAPTALPTLVGPMTPGCCGPSNSSFTLQLARNTPARATLSAAARRARYVILIMCIVLEGWLVVEGQAGDEVGPLSAGGVGARVVRVGVRPLGIRTGISGPEAQVAACHSQLRVL